jgi:antitoxin VapB
MESATVITEGNTQTIKLPREFHVDEKEFFVKRMGSSLVLLAKENPWELFNQSLNDFNDDFFADGRKQPAV